MKLSAIIFDLNGTVLDDEDIYGYAFNKVLRTLGVETRLTRPHMGGIGVKENWVRFRAKYEFKTDKTDEELVDETQKAYLERISGVSVRPGFMGLLDFLEEKGIKTALATSNSWEVAAEVLRKLDLTESFEAIVTEEEVENNKPAPDLFILAAEKLEVDASDCLVIEDAPAGIEAAKLAGMRTFHLTGNETFPKVIDHIRANLYI